MSGDLSRHPMFAKRHTAYNADEPPPPLLSALNSPSAATAATAAPSQLFVNSQPQQLLSPVGSSSSPAPSPSASSAAAMLAVSPSGPPLPSSAPASRPSLPRSTPAASSAAPQRASLGSPAVPAPSASLPASPTSASGARMPVAQPVVFASGSAPQGHPMFASSPSSAPHAPSPSAAAGGSSLPSIPTERVLALQTGLRSSPAPSSSQLSPTGQSAVVFSGSGGSAAAQPVQLRDPAELVQRATADGLRGVSDWGLNMRVVDLVNNAPDKAEYILQSLMPRLLSKDHAVGLTALAVSPLAVHRFH